MQKVLSRRSNLAIFVAISLAVAAPIGGFFLTSLRPGLDSPSSFPWLSLAVLTSLAAVIAVAGTAFESLHRSKPNPPPTFTDEKYGKAKDALDAEVSHLAELMASGRASHENYARTLHRVQAKLAVVQQPEQLRTLAGALAAENQAMRRDARALAQQLEASRQQIESLRSSLLEERQHGMSDALTGVGNRRSFDAFLEEAMAAAISADTSLALILVDIDHFKSINDTHGHVAGDEVIKSCARLLVSGTRKGDHVSRIGGEEFALVLPDTSDLVASISAERLRVRVEDDGVEIGADDPVRYTASFGVAQLQPGDTPETFIQRADARMYKAKNQGRNRVITL